MKVAVKTAFDLALKASEKAHCVYSKYAVGAALKAKGTNEIFYGCNVENASFGAPVCAERSAIFNMVSRIGKTPIEFIVLVTDTPQGAPPCGMCLQVMSEFCEPAMPVYLCNLKGIVTEVRFDQLLPQVFHYKV